MAAQSSLYNEDRNLLRIRERERRNQEALQERDPFPDQAPLFPEPYKTSKGDELSSRIQSMLGNYEEVKELIGPNRNQNFIGIPKSAVPVALQNRCGKPNEVPRHSFQSGTHRHVGTSNSSSGVLSGQQHKPHTGTDLTTGQSAKSYVSARGQPNACSTHGQATTGSKTMENRGSRAQESSGEHLSPSSISALSPLLSPPGEPLSPLHSSHEMGSKLPGGQSLEKPYNHVSKSPSMYETGKKDGGSSVTNLVPSTQTFATSLTSKNNVMPQKPTAYVRPMDGLDQASNDSPDLKSLQDDYDGAPYGTYSELKAKEKLSKPEMPPEPLATFSNEAHCVEEILKEMTHSWPPPLTAIHTPHSAELSKCAFPTKESQQVASVNQKQHDTSSRVSQTPQQRMSMLQADLQISDSDDSDDSDEGENSEKTLSSSAPSSVQQSQPNSVVSADVRSAESESGESDSSSDSESESSSSDSEVKEPPKTVSVELSAPSTNIWQLNNWMKRSTSTDNPNAEDHDQPSSWDGKVEESPKTIEPLHKTPPWTSQEEILNKLSHPKSPVSKETVLPRQTVGIKQPRKPIKALVTEEPKGGLTVESEPAPYRPRDQPSKEKPTVKTKAKIKSNPGKEPKSSSVHTVEKKHKSSRHGGSSKKCSNNQSDKNHSAPLSPQNSPIPKGQNRTNHRVNTTHPAVVVCEDSQRDKVLLPIGENRLLPPQSKNARSLIVKINLALLSRNPRISVNVGQPKSENGLDRGPFARKGEPEKKKKHSKDHDKRKVDGQDSNGKKKTRLETDTKSSSTHKEFSTGKEHKRSSEKPQHKEHRSQKNMCLTGQSQKTAERHGQKRKPSDSGCNQESTATSGKSNPKEPSSSKHRRVEEKVSEHAKSNKASTENITPSLVPSLPNGNAKPTRPQLKFEEKLYSSDHYMSEAKKLKHKADAMPNKIAKALNYLDAAMYFIECGLAMESDAQTPKSAYTMFAETIDLIKFIMKQNNFTDRSAPAHEKALATLCMRCQSVLFMAMFRYKKDTVFKYSRTLGEHFKSSSRAAQAPSQCVGSSGTPSPLSQTNLPCSSGGSQQRSITSNGGEQASSINIPQVIHQVASSYVNITSYFLNAYDIWEQADLLAKENKEFFADLGGSVCPLALNSTMIQLVHYTRQGLQWLRLESGMA